MVHTIIWLIIVSVLGLGWLRDAVVRMMCNQRFVCHSYLDDFICLGKDWDSCGENELTPISLLRSLGFYTN